MTESRESRVWGDEGVEPDPGEETYEGGEQPIAEYDNWAMWSVTNDIETLFAWLDTVEDDLDTHIADDTNPHNVTEEQTGAAASLTAHEDSTTDVHGIEGEDSVAGVSDIETHRETEVHDEPQPAQTHGNEDHTETFAVDGDAQPPEEHANEVHTEDFETESGAQQRVDDHESETSGVHGVESGDIASTDDVSPIQASSDVDHNDTQGGTSGTPHDHADPDDPVTQFDPGDVADGEVLTNENGSLTGTEIDVDTETEIDLIEVATTDDLPDPDELDDPTIAYVDESDDYLGVFQE